MAASLFRADHANFSYVYFCLELQDFALMQVKLVGNLPILLGSLTTMVVVEIKNNRLLQTGSLDYQPDRIEIDTW